MPRKWTRRRIEVRDTRWKDYMIGLRNDKLTNTTHKDGRYSILEHTREPKNLYFVQTNVSKAVKIGVTTFPVSVRLAHIQTGNHEDLSLILTVPNADPYLEKDIHLLFEKDRIRGEWFRTSPELLAFVERSNCARN